MNTLVGTKYFGVILSVIIHPVTDWYASNLEKKNFLNQSLKNRQNKLETDTLVG